MEISPVMTSSPLFREIVSEELADLLTCLDARERRFRKGETLLRRGEPTARLGLVLSGAVHMVREDFWGGRSIVGLAGPGEVFAETYALGGQPLEVSVLAAADTAVLFLDAGRAVSGCQEVCACHQQLTRNLLALLAEKNRMLTRKMGHMARRTTRDKLLSYLSAQALQAGGPEFDIPLDRQQLADYLAVDRSAMSAALGKLRREGILTFRKTIFISCGGWKNLIEEDGAMVTRVPDYFKDFRCLAGTCPHTCCAKWEVVIDEETACRYAAVPGALGDKLRSGLQVDEDGDFCFPLDGGRCPFLDGENLCEIHKELGEEATSVTCREHPRFTEDYGAFREITLSASCPAANALLLGTNAPLAFVEQEDGEMGEDADDCLAYLLPLRERMLAILTDRTEPFRVRLRNFLLLACEAQLLLDEERVEDLPALAETWQPGEVPATDGPGLFPVALRFLGTLEVLEPDWRELLTAAGSAAPIEISEVLLERVAVYFTFRYLLKCVNDGDLLGRAQLCVFAVLTVERLAGVCGGLSESLRRFSCEIEHSDGNLEALQDAFWQEEGLTLEHFLQELAAC